MNKPFSIEDFKQKCAIFIGGIYCRNTKSWGFGNARVEKDRSVMIEGKQYSNVVWAQRFEKELKFNDDWNWIMMVIEKIESMYHSPVDISGDTCIIRADTGIFTRTAVNKKNATIECIDAFLDWYNENKKDDAPDTK